MSKTSPDMTYCWREQYVPWRRYTEAFGTEHGETTSVWRLRKSGRLLESQLGGGWFARTDQFAAGSDWSKEGVSDA